MHIDIITVLPELLEGPLNHSILKRAQDKKLAEIVVHNLRDYSTNKHRRVDDYPFGGSAGMVMQVEPIDRIISKLKSERNYDEIIYTSPDGETFNQPMANTLSLCQNLIILCGQYRLPHSRTSDYQRNINRRLCPYRRRISGCHNIGCHNTAYTRRNRRRTIGFIGFFPRQFISTARIYTTGRI